MSRPPPPEDGPTIPPLNTVDKILKFVDKPWKIVAVVIFVILGIAGWTVWETAASSSSGHSEPGSNRR